MLRLTHCAFILITYFGVIMITKNSAYQVSTLAGVRGQVGDTLLDLKTPGLFVVGERASQCNTDDIEVRIISLCT